MKNQIREMQKTLFVITMAAGLTTVATQAQDPQSPPGPAGYQATPQPATVDHSANKFIKQAVRDNQTEIDLAVVGMAKAQNENLKAFCQQLQQDHSQANKELQPIALRYGVTQELPKRGEREVNKLEKENSGPEFDKKFAAELLRNHKAEIAKFEHAAAKLQEMDVRQYAEGMLPKLHEHMQRAETVAREVGVDQNTISSILTKAPAVGGTSETEESGTGTGASRSPDESPAAKQPQPVPPPNQP